MKRNLNKFAATLLFASVAITCSLTMWASPLVHGKQAGISKTSTPAYPLTQPDVSRPIPLAQQNPRSLRRSIRTTRWSASATRAGVLTYYGGLTFQV